MLWGSIPAWQIFHFHFLESVKVNQRNHFRLLDQQLTEFSPQFTLA